METSRPQEAAMNDQPNPACRPWHRFVRFSVRGLIVLVLAVGVLLGWTVRSARIQREAVAAIKNAGGNVTYDWEWNNGKSIPAGRPWGPQWLANLIGVDYFGHVTTVGLYQPINDSVIVQVARLTSLQQLHLSGTSTSASGLSHLKGLTNLWSLTIQSTPVTDAGLVQLEGLPNLSELYLDDAQVTDAELVHLKAFTKLSYLSLWGNDIDDAGLVQLEGPTSLTTLSLTYTQITDAGLVHLKGLTKLSTLDLGGTKVSDAGLPHLKSMTKLSDLNLTLTHVTAAGVKELQQALPGLTIER